MARQRQGFVDGTGARIAAIALILLCVAALAYMHRKDLFPRAQVSADAGLNPEFVKCRNERTGQVDKMLADGVIDGGKSDLFKTRAIAFCTAQFPPDQNSVPAN